LNDDHQPNIKNLLSNSATSFDILSKSIAIDVTLFNNVENSIECSNGEQFIIAIRAAVNRA
jgi:hypothetical protein